MISITVAYNTSFSGGPIVMAVNNVLSLRRHPSSNLSLEEHSLIVIIPFETIIFIV